MKKIFFVCILFLGFLELKAQNTQTIKGQILDSQSKYPIVGASVVILNSNPLVGAVSDVNGFYKIEKVPLGRISLKISFVGYTENIVSNILLTSGKEMVLNLRLEESVETLEELVITSEEKGAVQNEMALVSTRSFSIEETSRYAGSRNDPARMATNFAGVSGANDGRNDIIIRGNSPAGVLWRLEGLDIFSPNHFAAMGTTGGPVGMLNNNVLANSDFMIGAFPSQYGNAMSGVFDLKMRSGNHEKHEFLGQIGFNGFELGAEGYLSRKKRSSYLANYRYSALGFFQLIGVSFGTGDAVPYYQDLSFKVDLPTSANDKVTVFGVGGLSNIGFKGSDRTGKDLNDNFYSSADRNLDYRTHTFSGGASYLHFFNSNTFSKLILGVSTLRTRAHIDTVFRDSNLDVSKIIPRQTQDLIQTKYTLHYQINSKINSKNTILAGFIGDFLAFDLTDKLLIRQSETSFNRKGNTFLGQFYMDWQHRFTEKATLNVGLHSQGLALNSSFSLEPRLAFKYQISKRISTNIGYGRVSQMQGIQMYFVETNRNGQKYYTNEKMGFSVSDQFVAGFDVSINPKSRFKLETYYQHLSNIPIETRKNSFSMINAGADFGLPDTDSLYNGGTGRNYGVEMTLEHFFIDSYYYLLTVSLFDSKYKGSDGIERNTAFNGNYVVNALFGKEFRFNEKNSLSFDLKTTLAGGRRYTPIDLEASRAKNETVRTQETFSRQYDPYFRLDAKITFRRNGKKVHQEWALDIQNMTNHQNMFIQDYSPLSKKVENTYQLGFFPLMQYRILF